MCMLEAIRAMVFIKQKKLIMFVDNVSRLRPIRLKGHVTMHWRNASSCQVIRKDAKLTCNNASKTQKSQSSMLDSPNLHLINLHMHFDRPYNRFLTDIYNVPLLVSNKLLPRCFNKCIIGLNDTIQLRTFENIYQKCPLAMLTTSVNSERRMLLNRSQQCSWLGQTRDYSTCRDKSLPIIYLFTKDGCTLCDQAKAVLEPYRHRFTLLEVDIEAEENADWYKKYKYDIPVFHMHEDFLFMHKVDLGVLERALKQYEENRK